MNEFVLESAIIMGLSILTAVIIIVITAIFTWLGIFPENTSEVEATKQQLDGELDDRGKPIRNTTRKRGPIVWIDEHGNPIKNTRMLHHRYPSIATD